MNHKKVFVIAEASGNHGKNYDRAKTLIDIAAQSGADAVKFQTFEADEISAKGIDILKGYDGEHDQWINNLGISTLHELLRLGGLPRKWHIPLAEYAQVRGIEFMSTPFSVDAAKFLVEVVKVKRIKVASGDITFLPLLAYLNSIPDIPVILSTGASTLVDIETALMAMSNRSPQNTALLHCVSAYPCPTREANIHAIHMLKRLFTDHPVGYSDHTISSQFSALVAVGAGATILEKHFTFESPEDEHPGREIDAPHSLNDSQLDKYVSAVRMAEKLAGSGTKKPLEPELHDRLWARRSDRDWLRPTERARQGEWADT